MEKERDIFAVWNSCLKIIQENIPSQSFKTWFEPIRPIKLNNGVLTIHVPSQFFYEWLEENYVSLLRKTIRRELGKDARLEYNIVVDSGNDDKHPYTINIPTLNNGPARNTPISLPINISTSIRNPFIIPGLKKNHVDPQLNPSYTFETFIEGECNSLARASGYAVANKPGNPAFNPLMLYGGTGLGKTHLIHAIGNQVKELFPEKIVLYVSIEKFTSQYIEAVKNNNLSEFNNFYQQIDVLLIDDIHFLSGKERTQDNFFHLFNNHYHSGKQIVLSSDCPPMEMKDIEERLISRFKWGLTADLQPPDFETRVAILLKKMYADGIEIPKDIVEYIAHNINTNVRELEGALHCLIVQSSLNRKEINLNMAKQMMKNFIKNITREISIDYIQKLVCDYFDMPDDSLKSKTRKREVVQARQIAMFFAKDMTKSSLKTIGTFFGNRDHSTVIHAVQTVNDLMDTDRKFKNYMEEIARKIKMNTM